MAQENTFTFEQLIAGLTIEQAEEELLEFLQDQGIQTTDWKAGSPELTMLKMDALVYSNLVNRAAQNARNALNQFSSGSALTELASSHFNNTRQDAEFAKGMMVVTGSSAVVPKTWQPSELIVTDGTYNFFNEETITISNAVPYVTSSFIAEDVGGEYNIPSSSSLSFASTETGFSVQNPTYLYGISGSWLTQLGRDEETDNTLRQRNQYTYTSFQTGDLTIDRVRLIALSASSDLTYVSIEDDNPRGPFTVNVWLSTDTATASSASVAAVQTILNNAFWGNFDSSFVSASAAVPVTFDRPITVYYSKGAFLPTVKAEVDAACDAWIADSPIGGKDYSPYGSHIAHLNDLVTDINNIEFVERVEISGSSYITLGTSEKLVSPTVSGSSYWDDLVTMRKLEIL